MQDGDTRRAEDTLGSFSLQKVDTQVVLTGGFLIGVLLLTLNAVLPYYNAQEQFEKDRWVRHTHEVIRMIHLVELALVESTSAQRAYLLTGDEEQLGRYAFYRDTLRERLDRLVARTQDNADQQANLAVLGQFLNKRIENLQENIEAFESQRAPAYPASLAEPEDSLLLRQISDQLRKVEQEEQSLLMVRTAMAEQAGRNNLSGFLAITAANVILFLGLFWAVMASFRRRKSVQQQLEEQSALQASILNSVQDALVVFDKSGRPVVSNPAADQLLGPNLHHVELSDWQRSFGLLAEETDQPLSELPVRAVLDGEPGRTEQARICRPYSGGEKYLSMSARPVRDAAGDLQGALSVFTDVTERKRQEWAIREANDRLSLSVSEMKRRNREMGALNELTGLLQASRTLAEAVTVVLQSASALFPGYAGAIYLLHDSDSYLECLGQWGGEGAPRPIFAPEDCWAVRRGRPHLNRPGEDLGCAHINASTSGRRASICSPFLAQGQALGLLVLEETEDTSAIDTLESRLPLITSLCEQTGLGLFSIKLRAELSAQSNQDALTGLYNRRFLDSAFPRELARARRLNSPLSLLMLDVDYFKRINDTYGHDAGDAALKALGEMLDGLLRESDVACRYGGEEFSLLLPDTDHESALQCARRILEATRELRLVANGHDLGRITLSIGMAVYPQHASSAEEFRKMADTCLYEAKNSGRDRIVFPSDGPAEIDSPQ